MATTNTSFTSLISAIDTKAQSLASSTTDPKDLVYLGKAVEALNVADTVSSIIDEGVAQVTAINTAGTTQLSDVNTAGTTQLSAVNTAGATQVTNIQNEGATQVSAVQAAGTGYASLTGATFTGAVNGTDLTLSGNLTVQGTQTTLNTATLDVADINITIADGAANSAAADGAGITIEGAAVNFQYSDSGKHMSLNTGLKLQDIREKVQTTTGTGGYTEFAIMNYSVLYNTANQASNATINFVGNGSNTLDSIMAVGESITTANLRTQGGTAYYPSTIQVDGTAVTPKWQGGSAPTGGNASGIDVYTFTIIKTAAATFTVLASQTQFA